MVAFPEVLCKNKARTQMKWDCNTSQISNIRSYKESPDKEDQLSQNNYDNKDKRKSKMLLNHKKKRGMQFFVSSANHLKVSTKII